MKLKGIILGATALVIALTAVICAMVSNGVFNPYEHQLSLAQKFLEEGNYEEAIIAFNKAIEIDSKRLDTYFALAEVYFENLDDLGGVKETLQRAYENTSEDSVAEKYIEFADRLIEKGRNTDAMELLSSGFDLTGNEDIKNKIGNMLDNLQLDDVTDTMSEELKEDFERFVKEAAVRNEEDPYYEDLLNSISIFIRFDDYLENSGYKYGVESVGQYGDVQRVKANQMDWILVNYLNLAPDHTIKDELTVSPEETIPIGFIDDYYYVPTIWAGDMLENEELTINKIYKINDSKYYIEWQSWGWNMGDTRETGWLDGPYYGIYDRRSVDGIEFWTKLKQDISPISLREFLER